MGDCDTGYGPATNSDKLENPYKTNVLVYDHPVYMSVVDDDGNGDIMMFTGIRWGMFPIPLELKGQINVTDRLTMANNYLSSDLDVYMFLNSRELFVSDFVIFDYPVRRGDTHWSFVDTGVDETRIWKRHTV